MKSALQENANPLIEMSGGPRLVIIAGMTFVVGAVGAFALSANEPARIWAYAAFTLHAIALTLPFCIKAFRLSYFHPVVFYVLWVGYRRLFVEGTALLPVIGLDYHAALGRFPTAVGNEIIAKYFLLETLAIVALYAGYLIAPSLRVSAWRVRSGIRLGIRVFVWIGIAAAAAGVIVLAAGGMEQLLMQRGLPRDQRAVAQIGGHWHFLAGVGPVACIVWCAAQPRAIRRVDFWVLLVLGLGIKFAATGSRGGTLMPLVLLAALWALQHRRVPYRAMVVLVFVVLLGAGLGQEFRVASMRAAHLDQVSLQRGVVGWMAATMQELHNLGSAGSGPLAIVGLVPDRVEHLYGESYLSLPYIVVPRALIGAKPPAGGQLTSQRLFGADLNTIPPRGVGEAYWNFSYLGVVAIFLIYGAFLRTLVAVYLSNRENPAIMVMFLYILFYGDPATDAIYSVVHAMVLVLMIWASFAVSVGQGIRRARRQLNTPLPCAGQST